MILEFCLKHHLKRFTKFVLSCPRDDLDLGQLRLHIPDLKRALIEALVLWSMGNEEHQERYFHLGRLH